MAPEDREVMLSSSDEEGQQERRWHMASDSSDDGHEDDFQDALARSLAPTGDDQDETGGRGMGAISSMQDAPPIPVPSVATLSTGHTHADDAQFGSDVSGNISYCATAPFGTFEPEPEEFEEEEEGRRGRDIAGRVPSW